MNASSESGLWATVIFMSTDECTTRLQPHLTRRQAHRTEGLLLVLVDDLEPPHQVAEVHDRRAELLRSHDVHHFLMSGDGIARGAEAEVVVGLEQLDARRGREYVDRIAKSE